MGSSTPLLHWLTASLFTLSFTFAIAAAYVPVPNVSSTRLIVDINQTIVSYDSSFPSSAPFDQKLSSFSSPSPSLMLFFLSLSSSSLSLLSFVFIAFLFLTLSALSFLFPPPASSPFSSSSSSVSSAASSSSVASNQDGCHTTTIRRFHSLPLITPEIAARAATYPNPYPCGWFKLCYMEDMKEVVDERGEKKYLPFNICAVGESFTITRSVPASPVFWSSASSTSDSSPSSWPLCILDSAGRRYHCALRLGGVYVWWGREGKRGGDVQPEWNLELGDYYTQFATSNFRFLFPCETTFGMYINELSANSPDYAHFNVLHQYLPIPLVGPLVQLRHTAVMSTAKERNVPSHWNFFLETVKFYFLARWRLPLGPFGDTSAHVSFEGPGLVHFEFKTFLGAIHLLKSITPVGPLNQLICDQWFAERTVPTLYAILYTWAAKTALDQDRTVWENKIYKRQAIFSSADGPFGPFRKWHKQFC